MTIEVGVVSSEFSPTAFFGRQEIPISNGNDVTISPSSGKRLSILYATPFSGGIANTTVTLSSGEVLVNGQNFSPSPNNIGDFNFSNQGSSFGAIRFATFKKDVSLTFSSTNSGSVFISYMEGE